MDPVLAGLLGAIAVGIVAGVLVWRIQQKTQQLAADTASLRAELGAEQQKHQETAELADEAAGLKVDKARLEQELKDTAKSIGERDDLEKRFNRHLRGPVLQDARDPAQEFPDDRRRKPESPREGRGRSGEAAVGEDRDARQGGGQALRRPRQSDQRTSSIPTGDSKRRPVNSETRSQSRRCAVNGARCRSSGCWNCATS